MKKNNLTKEELFYESIAQDFDNLMNLYEVSKRLDIIFNKILDKNLTGKTLLDAGCGTGLFSQAAAQKGAKVTSLDVGPELLKEVAKKCDSKRVVGGISQLPFKDNSFDIVIATEVIEHTLNPKKSVEELCRVAKPNGLVIVTVPNRIWRISAAIAKWLRVRPYHAYENWVWFWQLNKWMKESSVEIDKRFGFNIIPVYHPALQPLISSMDSFGKLLMPVMVNLAFVGKKNEMVAKR